MLKHENIEKLINALEIFREIDPAMSLPSMLALLYYHDVEGRSGNRSVVEERLQMTGATASRATLFWHEFKAPYVPGHNHLTREEDPRDRRFQIIRYNRQGLQTLARLSEAID